MENKELESIWADGIPPKIDPNDLMKPEDNLNLCFRFFVERYLKNDGGVLENFNLKLKSLPNILYKKNGKRYGICLVPCIFPYMSNILDNVRISFVNECKKNNIIPVMTCIMIASYDKARANKQILLKGDIFNLKLIGSIELVNDEIFDFKPENLTFKFE